MTADILLEANHIGKTFPGVRALRDVHLELRQGEILAVIGENGAGKSTLMKILAGIEEPDEGEIRLDGKPVSVGGVAEAQELGITLIHQELNLATNLDVASNIFLGREPRRGGWLGLLRSRLYSDSEIHMRKLGLDCSPRTVAGKLSIGKQQLVEVARALSLRSRVLIMDEPTSSLTQRETERLFEVIRELQRDGISVLYISHRLREVEEIADRVVVLRDGRNAGELAREEIDHEAMVRLMVGRELNQFFQRSGKPSAADTEPLLKVENLRLPVGGMRSFGFELRAGEIVGMAGLMGAGRTELAEALFGVAPPISGTISMSGVPVHIRSVPDAIRAGIFLLPEDRRLQGLVLAESVKNNLTLAAMEQLTRFGLIRGGLEKETARALSRRLNVRAPHLNQTVGLLSGGNQQKVVLGKGLSRAPRLFIMDEPTRGIDVGAKREIYTLMDKLAQEGTAILMISSDLEEILGMSDRVLVMHEGTLAGELARDKLSEEAIMRLATGGAVGS